jgi:hypothetical protein
MLIDGGAYYSDCYYNYANLRTAPGHATLLTGTYTIGHGIPANDWWSPEKDRVVTSVEDDSTQLLGGTPGPGASPHNLLADTLGDELRLATGGRSRSFGVALKDRSSILPVGYSGNAAYWIDKNDGTFETSTYYMPELPAWVRAFNASGAAEKYWNIPWKDAQGRLLRDNKKGVDQKGVPLTWYDVLGSAPAGIEHQLAFVKELVGNEKLGSDPTTDLLTVSISSTDILGHQVGPDSPEYTDLVLSLDRQLAGFFQFLDRQVGLKNTWIALSADHGVGIMNEFTRQLHIPAVQYDANDLYAKLNLGIAKRLNLPAQDFVNAVVFPYIYLAPERFAAARLNEQQAEELVADLLKQEPVVRDAYTRVQLAAGDLPNDERGLQYRHSYSAAGGWYTLAVPAPFFLPYATGDDHYSLYSYDTHVPLALWGEPFAAGIHRNHCEPVDLAPTLASLLGINRPTHAIGRVLTEALKPAGAAAHAVGTGSKH